MKKALILLPLAFLAAPCFGSTATYILNGTSSAGRTVNTSATFNLSTLGALTLTVQNLTTNPTDVTQVITGFVFSLSGLSNSATVSNSSGQMVQIDSPTPTNLGTQSLTGWNTSTSLQKITMTVLGNGQPDYGIIGAPGSGGTYSNGNGSIVGNSAHNPFVYQTATFVFNSLPGISGASNIATLLSGVQFGFGTAGTNYINATPQVVSATPEPASALLIAPLLGGAWYVRRRRARRA